VSSPRSSSKPTLTGEDKEESIVIWIYRFLFPILFLVSLPYYFGRMLKRGGYSENFGERFGSASRVAKNSSGKTIWIQAVSVGEVLAIVPVIERLKERIPDCTIILTTTTSTGYKLAKETVKNVDHVAYFPLDFWPISHRVWQRFKPDLCLLMEGELWPEHLHQAKRRNIPVLLVNARLSDRSFRRYQKAGIFKNLVFAPLRKIAAASPEDAGRLREIAGSAVEVEVTGNLKFDVDFPPKPDGRERQEKLIALGLSTNPNDQPMILLGSSTWSGEEKMLCRVFKMIRAQGENVRLVIVPRHAERRREILQTLKSEDLAVSVRSTDGPCARDAEVYLADTTGELRMFTSLADLAFIGKSLYPNEGGQTPIEAAAYGVPMVYGPNMSNFKAACRGLEETEAALKAESETAAERILVALAQDPLRRKQLGTATAKWCAGNRGSVGRTVDIIAEVLPFH